MLNQNRRKRGLGGPIVAGRGSRSWLKGQHPGQEDARQPGCAEDQERHRFNSAGFHWERGKTGFHMLQVRHFGSVQFRYMTLIHVITKVCFKEVNFIGGASPLLQGSPRRRPGGIGVSVLHVNRRAEADELQQALGIPIGEPETAV